jgi:hypothetical protein
MTLDDIDNSISKMMTCTADINCKKEEWCFHVAQYAHECRSKELLQQALNRVNQSLNLEEEIEYFTPPIHWESHLPPRW